MSALNPRNKIVIFRLTVDEFASLKRACAKKGGRNLSEFTRSELLNLLHAQSEEYLIQTKLDAIELKLTCMHTDMGEMSHLLDGGMRAKVPQETGVLEEQKLTFDVRSTRCD
jgi:hypothetical protein